MRIVLFTAVLVITASTAHAACIDDLKQAADKQLSSGPMRVTVNIDNDGAKSEGLIEIVSPAIWQSNDSVMEFYTDGKSSWIKPSGVDEFQNVGGTPSIYEMTELVLDSNLKSPGSMSELVCSQSKDYEGKTYPAIDYSNYKGITKVSVYLNKDGAPEVIHARTDDPKGIIKANHHTYRITYDPNLTLKMPK